MCEICQLAVDGIRLDIMRIRIHKGPMITRAGTGRTLAFVAIGAYSALAWALLISIGIRLLRLSGF
jgi:hypothetical protein